MKFGLKNLKEFRVSRKFSKLDNDCNSYFKLREIIF